MNGTNEDCETAAKRARLETKWMRKRFSFHRTAGMTGNKQSTENGCLDGREKREQNASNSPVTQQDNCESSKEKAADAELERFVCFSMWGLLRKLSKHEQFNSRLAAEELMQEAARTRTRVEIRGPSEWRKKPGRVNKRFVANSILHTESQNKRKSKKLKE